MSDQDISSVRHRPAPSALNVPGLPAGVDGICLRCFEERPWRRPTAEQIAEVLRAFPVPGKEMWKPLLAQTGPSAPNPQTFTGPTEVKRLRRQHRTHPPRRGKAAVMTAAAFGIAVITWAVAGWTPATDSPPQASMPAVAAPAAPTAIGCEAGLQLNDDGNGRFTAGVTVTNLDQQPITRGWRLRFHLPAGWQPDQSGPVGWHQDGHAVMSDPSLEPLASGRTVQLTMSGTSGESRAGEGLAPSGFTVDGRPCAATVATSTTQIAVVNLPAGTDSQPAGQQAKGNNDNGSGNNQSNNGGNDQGNNKQNSARRN